MENEIDNITGMFQDFDEMMYDVFGINVEEEEENENNVDVEV